MSNCNFKNAELTYLAYGKWTVPCFPCALLLRCWLSLRLADYVGYTIPVHANNWCISHEFSIHSKDGTMFSLWIVLVFMACFGTSNDRFCGVLYNLLILLQIWWREAWMIKYRWRSKGYSSRTCTRRIEHIQEKRNMYRNSRRVEHGQQEQNMYSQEGQNMYTCLTCTVVCVYVPESP